MITKQSPISRLLLSACAALALAGTSRLHAQWATENYQLKAGWNAIWLPLDVSHEDILTLAAPDVEEVWRWNAAEAGHFTDVPGLPDQGQLEWNVWHRLAPENSSLNQMTGNTAYLVKVTDGSAPFTWSIKGKPLKPGYSWSSSGLNLVGFPIAVPAVGETANLRNFSRFFGYDSVLKTNPPVFYYNGGPLSDVAPKNPLVVSPINTTQVVRGRAYWVKSTSYTEYYGPVGVEVSGNGGLNFGTGLLSTTVRVKNVVDPVRNQTVTITFAPVASEAAPAGQPAVAGPVPLLVRGALNLTTGQRAYEALTAPITRVLAPGQETELVFTVNRSLLGNTPGALFQSLLRVTDSLSQTRIDLPVSAETTSRAGLWAGAAVITSVEHVTMTRTGDDSGNEPEPGSPEPVIDPATGLPVITRTTTKALENAPSQFAMNLLVHSDASGTLRLLQQAFTGEQAGQSAIAAAQSEFSDLKKVAGRTSTACFPAGLKQAGSGTLGLSGAASFTFSIGPNDGTNPFLHTYHPDHDNLDPRFAPLSSSYESPQVLRVITMTFKPNHPLGFNPAWGAGQLGGDYTETVTGLRAQPIVCSGSFILQRVDETGTFLNP